MIPPTRFSGNPYRKEWFETDYMFTPEGPVVAPDHHCKKTFDVSFPFIRNRRNAIDIGCRLGEYSRYLQNYFDMTYCFDPNLWKQFSNNVDLKKVTHFNCALGDENGTIEMSGGTHRFVEGKMKKVSVFRLDDFELDKIDYIKIDVEGFERKVLAGGVQTIERDRPIVVIEQNEVRLPDEEPFAAKAWLEQRGYKHVATCPRGWDLVMVPE
jgi:FkbM family methyltransferase